jgi:hypothetical protein
MLDVASPPVRSLQPLRDDGLQVVRDFFTGEARDDLLRRGVEVIEGVASGRIRRNGQFALGFEDAWFEQVFGDPKLLDLVAEALGPDLCISTWRILMKDHHFDGPINVHQDWPYFGGDTRKLNVFIPMTPMNAENGGLVFFERSHLFGPLERGDIDVARYEAGLPRNCPDLAVGDVLLADFLTWHYSAPALAPKERILFQLVFQPADDPSSAHVVRGERRNPFVAQDRYTCLREPRSQMNVAMGRSLFEAGSRERAERFARGMLASDPDHVGAALLLSDILAGDGDHGGAAAALDQARAALDRLAQALSSRAPEPPPAPPPPGPSAEARLAALERELAEIKASRSWRWSAPLRRR